MAIRGRLQIEGTENDYMKQLILHIPHSSTHIPFKEGYSIDDSLLEQEILRLTDWHTDDLFDTGEDVSIIAGFSRLFCDPERFTDDRKEKMAQFGMGVLYEKTDAGEAMRTVSHELRRRILAEYYEPHHKRFTLAVHQQLQEFGRAMLIDCHSFPDIPMKRDLNQTPNRPDFNIGTDDFHTPCELVALSVAYFENLGFSVGIDWPYAGSIVPLKYYQKDQRVHSIMLEINRKLYLQEPSNQKSDRYSETKEVVRGLLKAIRNHLITSL